MNQLIQTKRGEFNVKIYGNKNHPPMMALHGWPQTSYCWHHVAPFLSDFYLIAPDLRGMGDSNRSLDLEAYEKGEMAKDMFAVADALGIENFSLAGHDWGGAIVQEMAFLHPERIHKLIVINMILIHNRIGKNAAAEIFAKDNHRSGWYQSFLSVKDFPEAMIAGKEEIWVRFFSRGITNPIPEDAIQEYIRCYKILKTSTTAANIYRVLPKDWERWVQFEGQTIKTPTLILHGFLDPVIIKEYLIGAVGCFRNISVQKIKGGHFVLDEQPEKVGKLISQFLIV